MYSTCSLRTVVHRPARLRFVGASSRYGRTYVLASLSTPGNDPRARASCCVVSATDRPSLALVRRAFRRTLGGPIAAVPAAFREMVRDSNPHRGLGLVRRCCALAC